MNKEGWGGRRERRERARKLERGSPLIIRWGGGKEAGEKEPVNYPSASYDGPYRTPVSGSYALSQAAENSLPYPLPFPVTESLHTLASLLATSWTNKIWSTNVRHCPNQAMAGISIGHQVVTNLN